MDKEHIVPNYNQYIKFILINFGYLFIGITKGLIISISIDVFLFEVNSSRPE